MPTFPPKGTKPYWTELKAWLTTALNDDGTLDADNVGYDPAVSGMTATNTKAAVDELHSLLGGDGPSIIYHDATAGTARPNTTGAVLWVGSVWPTNIDAASFDMFFDTANHAWYYDSAGQKPIRQSHPLTIVASSGASQVLGLGNDYKVTMDANCTFDFTAASDSNHNAKTELYLSGAYTPSWNAKVRWPSGSEPTYSPSGTWYKFRSIDGGTTIHGMAEGGSFS